jgi:hypothetical protein
MIKVANGIKKEKKYNNALGKKTERFNRDI